MSALCSTASADLPAIPAVDEMCSSILRPSPDLGAANATTTYGGTWTWSTFRDQGVKIARGFFWGIRRSPPKVGQDHHKNLPCGLTANYCESARNAMSRSG